MCVYPLLKNSIQVGQYPAFIEWVIKPPICPLRSSLLTLLEVAELIPNWMIETPSTSFYWKTHIASSPWKWSSPIASLFDKPTGPTFNTTHTTIVAAKILKSTWTNKMGWLNDMNIRLVLKLSQKDPKFSDIFDLFSTNTSYTFRQFLPPD